LAGRYRLVDQLSAGAGWTYWRATDETLARLVTVLTFALGFPRLPEAVTAARAASRLTDPRFAQVFDVEGADEAGYVVAEWVVGESLLDMLSEGPLDPARAVSLALETAQAVAAAHAVGLAHRRLTPACLHWTQGGGVKISGLSIDAALDGATPADSDEAESPELADTRALARLLYAALTGYWPGPQGPGPALLPPAPEADGAPCTSRQVSAAVPANVDAVICQTLFQRPGRSGPAISTAAGFADALAQVAPPSPQRFPGMPPPQPTLGHGGYDPSTNPYPSPEAPRPPRSGNGYRHTTAGRSIPAKAMVAAVVALLLATVGVVVWSAGRGHHTAPPQAAPSHSTTPAAAAAVLLKPVSATSFDPLGDGGGEDPGQAHYVIDGNNTTPWHTSYYLNYPKFGNLKAGTGLILDMGKQVRLSQVTVRFGSTCCAHVQIEIGNNNQPAASSLSTFTTLQSSDHAAGPMTFNVTNATTGRYVLIWLSSLPPNGTASQYQAFIYSVSVKVSVASQPG
jgi:hypothetical protein